MTMRKTALLTTLAAIAALAALPPSALADPPSWAPAYGARDHDEDRQDEGRRDEDRDHRHGWRRGERDDEDRGDRPRYGYDGPRGDWHPYRGYRGDDWDSDYGIVSTGRCNTDAVLGVTGAVTGAIIGNRSSAPENRGVATVFGAIAGGIIGSAIGNSIDDGDRACIGQSLELAPIGRPVIWVNPRSRVAWRLVPIRDVSRVCREFEMRRSWDGRVDRRRVVACHRDRGQWEFRGP